MDISECIKSRHFVRAYEDKPLPPDTVAKLEESISSANRDGSLSCRLILNDKSIFDTILNHYGWFRNVSNVIAVGYPMKPGKAHKSISFSQVSITDGPVPDWFKNCVESALLAPTAVNQQKFCFVLEGNVVEAKTRGTGSAVKINLGIVKEHFEEGTGRENFHWKS